MYKGLFQVRSGRKTDFDSYYTAAIAVSQNKNPYDRKLMLGLGIKHNSATFYSNGKIDVHKYVYPPLFAQLIKPLTFLNIIKARFVWSSIINPILFLISIIIIYKLFNFNFMIFFFCMSAVFFPFYYTLALGQVNLLILTLLILFTFCYIKKYDFLAALFLCLSIMIKISPAILLLMILFKRKWKLLSYLISIMLILVALSSMWNSFELYRIYFTKVLPGFSKSFGYSYKNQSFAASCYRLFSKNNFSIYLCQSIKVIFFIFILITLMKNKNDLYLINFLILSIFIFQDVVWQHHIIILLFPILTMFYYAVRYKTKIILILLSISYAVLSLDYKFYDPRLLNTIFEFFYSSRFIGILFLLLCYLIMSFKIFKNEKNMSRLDN